MKVVSPSIQLTAFSCPRCNAHASQTWAKVFAEILPRESRTPFVPNPDLLEKLRASKDIEPEMKKRLGEHFQRLSKGNLFYKHLETGEYVRIEVENLWISRCFNCEGLAVWIYDRLVYPDLKVGVPANPDLPDDIKRDFEEARGISDQSPRGAAALLRLAIQKLCAHLGESGKDLDQDISSLVKKGLNPIVQQSLDVVRVIGNQAVHPGVIDLRDDRATAERLFDLVNLVADQMISHPKSVQEIYAKLPASKLEAIEKRDR